MRHSGPSMATPGVYSPVDDEPVSIEMIQNEFDEDPEVGEALRHLVFSLENGTVKEKSFTALNERLFFLYLRARRRAEQRHQDIQEESRYGV